MFVSMQVEGRPPEGPMKEHLERRLQGAARTYGARTQGIALRATSTTLPRGKVHCRVAISLDTGVFTGAAKGANVYFAAEEAITKAVRNANKVLRREERPAAGLFLTPSTSNG